MAFWRDGLATDSNDVEILSQVAWVLSTSADAAMRNGAEALSLARRAADLPEGSDPAVLDVLAAAYAESGRFREAAETGRRALELATQQKKAALSQVLKARIALYDAGMPFRQPH